MVVPLAKSIICCALALSSSLVVGCSGRKNEEVSSLLSFVALLFV